METTRRAFCGGALAALPAALLTRGAAQAASSQAGRPAGWDEGRLQAVIGRATRNNVAALMVSQRGQPVLSHGAVERPFLLHSMRKSVISLLYGLAVEEGSVRLDTSIGAIGIDDYTPLTEAEKRATVRDLLTARSGVYLPASAESPQMAALRPARGSHPPGSFWYYNNWDFNALGEIYQRLTGRGVFHAFEHQIARPLGFQDFNPMEHGVYAYEEGAPRFPAYHFILSARDLMRMGNILLAGGSAGSVRLASPGWLADSIRPHSRTDYPGAMNGYGYLWWLATPDGPEPSPALQGAYTAAGAGGHFMTVIPQAGLVVVVRVDTFDRNIRSPIGNPRNYTAFLNEVLAARA